MSSKKKRQHYVWRKYLRAWAENEKIWTFFLELNKVEKPNLMGVGQEKYFYKLVDFTKNEEDFLKKLIDRMSPPVLKELNLDFLKMFTIHYKLKQSLNQKEVQNKQQIEEEISKIEINMMEDAHSKFELMGNKITSCRELEDLNFLNDEDDFFETNMFLCFQYFRTRGIKQNVLKSFASNEVQKAEKYWNIISFVMATVLARNLSLDKRIRFLLFENQTETPFITSDQPIFNILNDTVNEKGEVIELEFYYPLSPYRALSVHFNHQSEKFDRALINEQMVNWFNNKVVENSEYFVFANNQSQLDLLIR